MRVGVMDSSSFSPALIAPGHEPLLEALHKNPFLFCSAESEGDGGHQMGSGAEPSGRTRVLVARGFLWIA
ncbi:MAG: hypothetical protein WB297_16945 [Actinomycetota bacterium]